jgi:hypothetical protein
MTATRDIGERCVHCGESVAWGSGRYVNRILADTYDETAREYVEGYLCPECQDEDGEVAA